MRGAKPERGLEQYIEQTGAFQSSERIVVACSGGPDSVALAGVLHELSGSLNLHLILAYVNHATRPANWQDECVVLRLAAMFSSPVKTLSIEPGKRSEIELREARYKALVKIAQAAAASTIATAHHAEDQSETVLLALFRGAGPRGLSGMPLRRPLDGFGARGEIALVRPFLQVPSEDLRDYCHLRGLPYAVDPSNADQEIRRNAVRSALDRLRPLFPGLDRAISRSAANVTETTAAGERFLDTGDSTEVELQSHKVGRQKQSRD